jgi:RecJ-like exonuclease
VIQQQYDAYDAADIDEEECPHCRGSGQRGVSFDLCMLCGGSTVVLWAKAAAYRDRG